MNNGDGPMGMAAPLPTLHRLRQMLAGVDPGLVPKFSGADRLMGLHASIDTALGGGLSFAALHELAPATPVHLAAATGFAIALAALAGTSGGQTLWIATDFAVSEGGGPYGPGLDLFGLPSERLIVLRVPRSRDGLRAMEEELRCRALACIVAELTGTGEVADLTATRRLALAAREGRGLALLVRHHISSTPSAAATRWEIAAAPSEPDAFGGLGATRFELALCKNRRGPSGRWLITWDHHARGFRAAVPLGLAETACDRPDRAPLTSVG